MPEQRTALGLAIRTAGLSVAEAARRLGVSGKTAHRWLARDDADPAIPLVDQSPRPVRSPGRTADDLEAAVLEVRDRHGWGPRKPHAVLEAEGRPAPPPRTVAAILRRHGRAAVAGPPGPTTPPAQRFERDAPNQLWQLDFEGPLEVERRRVVPLSGLDGHSRYLLALRPFTDRAFATVEAVLRDGFGDVGLSEAVRCDNYFSARNALADPPGHPADPRPPLPPPDAGQGRAVPRHAGARAVADGVAAWGTPPRTWSGGGRCITPCVRTMPSATSPRPAAGAPAPGGGHRRSPR